MCFFFLIIFDCLASIHTYLRHEFVELDVDSTEQSRRESRHTHRPLSLFDPSACGQYVANFNIGFAKPLGCFGGEDGSCAEEILAEGVVFEYWKDGGLGKIQGEPPTALDEFGTPGKDVSERHHRGNCGAEDGCLDRMGEEDEWWGWGEWRRDHMRFTQEFDEIIDRINRFEFREKAGRERRFSNRRDEGGYERFVEWFVVLDALICIDHENKYGRMGRG